MKNKKQIVALKGSLTDLLKYYDRNTCTHEGENLVRGGSIWTICTECDMKWADDRGGFIPYVEPLFITIARDLLADVCEENK